MESLAPTTDGTWLCPTDLDRARLVEMTRRGAPAGAAGFASCLVLVVLIALRIGPALVLPFATCVVAQAVLAVVVPRAARPEWWLLAGDLSTAAAVAWGIALSGGGTSPLLAFCAFPLVTATGRYTLRGTSVVMVAALAAPLVGALFAVDRGNALISLWLPSTIAAIAGLAATVLLFARVERQYREQSLLDPLTGLLNRLALDRRFDELRAQACLSGGDLCLIAGDLDRFKAINDTHGHDIGDVVLRDVAYALRTSTRSFSLLYRIGGEEFVVLLPGLNATEGAEIAERLRSAVENCNPADINVTMSFGVASACGDAVDFGSLYRTADERLYAAKRFGRNQVVAADPGDPIVVPAAPGATRIAA
jgi:diguanylate cyclase (GGDEF)-like protein